MVGTAGFEPARVITFDGEGFVGLVIKVRLY